MFQQQMVESVENITSRNKANPKNPGDVSRTPENRSGFPQQIVESVENITICKKRGLLNVGKALVFNNKLLKELKLLRFVIEIVYGSRGLSARPVINLG